MAGDRVITKKTVKVSKVNLNLLTSTYWSISELMVKFHSMEAEGASQRGRSHRSGSKLPGGGQTPSGGPECTAGRDVRGDRTSVGEKNASAGVERSQRCERLTPWSPMSAITPPPVFFALIVKRLRPVANS